MLRQGSKERGLARAEMRHARSEGRVNLARCSTMARGRTWRDRIEPQPPAMSIHWAVLRLWQAPLLFATQHRCNKFFFATPGRFVHRQRRFSCKKLCSTVVLRLSLTGPCEPSNDLAVVGENLCRHHCGPFWLVSRVRLTCDTGCHSTQAPSRGEQRMMLCCDGPRLSRKLSYSPIWPVAGE